MPYRFRVVPERKTRKPPQSRKEIPGNNFRSVENGLSHLLTEARLFKGPPRDLRAELDAISCPTHYPKGDLLFGEGQKALGVFLLRSGRVKLSASSAAGKSVMVGRAGPEAILGLAAVISGNPHEVTAEAIDSLECGFIGGEALVQYLREHGAAALEVARILSGMYDATFNHVRYLGLSASAPEKLARLLLDLPTADANGHGTIRMIPLTHKEIAEMIGSSRETVTRLFTRFKRQQLVQVYDSRLHILDREGLEQLLAV